MASGQLRLIETAAKSAKRMGLDMIGMEGFTSRRTLATGCSSLFPKVRIFS